jgi:hypothetical protein
MHDRIMGSPQEQPDKALQSSRKYEGSRAVQNALARGEIFDKRLGPDTKVALIGDGQGADTLQFLQQGIKPERISSVNYDNREIAEANGHSLKGTGVTMRYADATDLESLRAAGISEGSQEVVVLTHVLETPTLRGGAELRLIENIHRILTADGVALASQYRKQLDRATAEKLGVEEITRGTLQKQFGADWERDFQAAFGLKWEQGMRFSDIANIRTKEELVELFSDQFEVRITEDEESDSFIIELKRRST